MEKSPEENQLTPGQGLPAPVCSPIFVIVEVTYDHYRFQENRGAATDIETARAIAARESVERGWRDDVLPILESADQSRDLDYQETPHIWIEVFHSENT
jgi:hypothetical protein